MEFQSLEEIEAFITDPEISVISFDVFDTLVTRNITPDAEMFALLNKRFRELSQANVPFGRLRIMMDAKLRRAVTNGTHKDEDITLDEVYDLIEREYGVPKEICDELKKEELRIEKKISLCRNSGKRLYDFAKATGKKVIMVSDMYLSADQIFELLSMHGYEKPDEFFCSSDIGLRKKTGNLYDYVVRQLGVKPQEILHIGDNQIYDMEMAKKHGLRTAWLPSAMYRFSEYGCGHVGEHMCRDLVNWQASAHELGMDIAFHMAANKYFDNPFRAFDAESDYNADPYFVGYAALGPELLSLTFWLVDDLRRDDAANIIFLARDGYLPMKAYEAFKKADDTLPAATYLYTSRLALLPLILNEKTDFFTLPVDLAYQTPEKVLSLLAFCAKEGARDLMESGGTYKNYSWDESFTKDGFHGFIYDFLACAYDEKKHAESKQVIRDYLSSEKACITDKTAIFDSGYSGRIAAAVKDAVKKDLLVYYIHTDGCGAFQNEARANIKIRSFFDFSPYMESTLREYAYLEPVASCTGYTADGREVFDEGPAEGYAECANAMQRGALDFVNEFIDTFWEFREDAACRSLSAAIPFEAFLRHCTKKDRQMFDGVLMDDTLWGGRRNIDLKELMEIREGKYPPYAGRRQDGL